MDGMGIFNFAMVKVPQMFEELISEANWNKEDIGTVVFHQANRFMVEYLRKRMRLTTDQAPIEVEEYGNTGPATIPLLLSIQGESLQEMKKLKKTVLLGFGVGLSWAGVTCDLNNTLFFKPIEI